MLSDRYQQLLTAYVDGELSTRQRRHVLRLLRRSAEARGLLHKMQQDARQLRELPRPQLGQDLSWSVLRAIHEGNLAPGPVRPVASAATTGLPAWAGLAAAAAVLVAVGIASYLFFASSLKRHDGAQIAEQQDQSDSPRVTPRSPNKPGKGSPADTRHPSKPPKPDHLHKPPRDPLVKNDFVGPPAPPHRVVKVPPKQDPFGSPSDPKEMFKPETVEVALPVIVKLQGLRQPAERKKLVGELKKDRAFRVELPCRDGTHAFERLQHVLRARQVGLIIDEVAQRRLKRPRLKTNYVVYAEDVMPEELAQIMKALADEDQKGTNRRKPDVRFKGHVVVTRLTPRHHKELSTLMGMDPTRVPPPDPQRPLGVAPGKSLPDLTRDQVALALQGKGVPRPSPGKPNVKPPQRFVLVMAYNPVRPHRNSAEIKRFLAGRRPPRPGAVRVLLVLRTVA